MNSVELIGRLVRDPEVRYTSGSQMAVATFSIAIDRPQKEGQQKQTDFPRITVFGRQAETCEKYLKKGKLVAIQGRIQTGSYTDKNGEKQYTTDIVANRVEFIDWGDKTQQNGQQAPQNGQYQQQAPQGGYQLQPIQAPPQQSYNPQYQNVQPQQQSYIPPDFEEVEGDVPY